MVRKIKLDFKIVLVLLAIYLVFFSKGSIEGQILGAKSTNNTMIPQAIEIQKFNGAGQAFSIIDNTANVSFIKTRINVYNTGSEPLNITISKFLINETKVGGPSNWFSASKGTVWYVLHLEPGENGYFQQNPLYDVKNHEGGTMTILVTLEAMTPNNITYSKNASLSLIVYPDSTILPNGSSSNFIPLPSPPPAPIITSPVNQQFTGTVPIAWNMPSEYSGVIIKYQIQYTSDGYNWKNLITNLPGTSTSYSFGGYPTGQYAIRVRGFDGYSWGPYQMSGTPPVQNYSDVLVLCSDNAQDSCEIANYFMTKRNIPSSNLCKVYSQGWGEGIRELDWQRTNITTCISSLNAQGKRINYIVYTRNMGIQYGNGWSGNPNVKSIQAVTMFYGNNANDYYIYNYSRARYNSFFYNVNKTVLDYPNNQYYYVAMLDGWTKEDAKALVDKADIAWGKSGVVVLDQAHTDTGAATSYSTYGDYESSIAETNRLAIERGYDTVYNCMHCGQSNRYITRVPSVGFLASWGSNDGSVLGPSWTFNTWVSGAIAETAVSTSGAGVNAKPDGYGQSRIVDMLHEGASGMRGSVAEPYISGISRPSILFERYTRGYNMVESYAMASPYTLWEDIILGDPKMAPYKWSPFTIN